jgi:predicted metal-binding membrane protein
VPETVRLKPDTTSAGSKAARSFAATTEAVPRRDRYIISVCLAIVTVLSWTYLAHLSVRPSSELEYARMMAAMGMAVDRPWTAVDGLLTFTMWSVMMVGMMTGSAAPMLLLFAAAQAKRQASGGSWRVLLFGLGYLAIWTGFSAIATFSQWALQRASLLSDTLAASSPRLAAAIVIIAGVYQLTPFKKACLSHCRSPLGFLMTRWRDGASGAFRMGVSHGLFCLGCCWALMIVLFAVGVMNLAWVAALTVLVLIEKLTPAGLVLSRVSALAMIGFGLSLWLKT